MTAISTANPISTHRPVWAEAAVTESAAAEVTPEARPNYVAIYSSSVFAVTVLFLIGVGAPIAFYLDDYVAGFGLGAFTALWGGPSFGVMAGSARVSFWFEKHDQHL